MSNDDNFEELPDEIDSLIDQLKNNNKQAKQIQKEKFELKSEDLEQFILNSSGQLIQDSMDMVSTVKQYVECAPDSEGVESLAELLKATTSSIDTLSKILVQNKRGDTSTKIKQMDIAAKQQLQQADHDNKMMLSRQEVLDQLIQNADVLEIKDVEEEST